MTKQQRRARLESARAAAEQAVDLLRKLGPSAGLAAALDGASAAYIALAALESTKEACKAWFEKAHGRISDSADSCRELGLSADLARALHNVCVVHVSRAGLEMAVEARRGWLDKGLLAIEEAVSICARMRRTADLAVPLGTASICYGLRAELETTPESRRPWLEKSVTAADQAVGVGRNFGVGAMLAKLLVGASGAYSARAALEDAAPSRQVFLRKAVAALEQADDICHELNMPLARAMSLGLLAQQHHELSKAETEPAEAARRRALSKKATNEALALLRQTGDVLILVGALRGAVSARLPDVQPGTGIDDPDLAALIDEGLIASQQVEDDDSLAFFEGARRQLISGAP